jgi:hypothetical protein
LCTVKNNDAIKLENSHIKKSIHKVLNNDVHWSDSFLARKLIAIVFYPAVPAATGEIARR